MDNKAFRKLSYGVYMISAADGKGGRAGCVVNTFGQITSDPLHVVVAMNKKNATLKMVLETGRFTAVAVGENVDLDMIGTFGFHTSTELDKFANYETKTDAWGIPYVVEHTVASFHCKVVNQMDAGSHILLMAEVEDAQTLSEEAPLTYAGYHKKKAESAPKVQPSASGVKWRCTVCGYIYEGDPLPEGFRCPICGQGPEKFVKV